MGFFKNIGKSIKKVTKQISFKNIVKIGASLDPTGIAGGIVASVQAKKDEKKALAEQAKAQAEYDKMVLEQNAAEAEKQRVIMEQAKATAEMQRQIVAANTQAIGGKVGVLAGSVAGQIGNAALNEAMNGINKDLQTGVAKAGATIANQTITEWLKIHWWKLLIGGVGLGLGLRFLIVGKRR